MKPHRKITQLKKTSLSHKLVEAAKYNKLAVITELLTSGADVHFNKDEALYAASWRGNEESVRLLLEHGADASSRKSAGAIEAARLGLRSIVEILNKNGASEDALQILESGEKQSENQKSCWAALIEAAREGRSDLLVVLLTHYSGILTPTEYASLVVEAARNEQDNAISTIFAFAHQNKLKPLYRHKKRSLSALKSELRRTRTEASFLRLQNEILRKTATKFCGLLQQRDIDANTTVLRNDPAIKKALEIFEEELK